MKEFVDFLRSLSGSKDFIPLHEPIFEGNEKKYLCQAIDSTYVSSVGLFVNKFEKMIAKITGVKHAVATVNGTSALHAALLVIGANNECEIITQPLTFVATCNAIRYTGANPVFIDVDKDTMGMSPSKLREFLELNSRIVNGNCINNKTGKKIIGCIPMHTFGFPCKIEEIKLICDEFRIILIEDSAEALGSRVGKKSVGTFGLMGVFSFNGNKIITSGGGGVVVTNDELIAKKVKHITTTSKLQHKWEYNHDQIGYNYRMPNINAAIACAQLEKLSESLIRKKNIHNSYKEFFKNSSFTFFEGIDTSTPNYWLMTIIVNDKNEKESFLKYSNENNVMTRPVWKLLNTLKMFKTCETGSLENAIWLEQRIVNLPSNFKLK